MGVVCKSGLSCSKTTCGTKQSGKSRFLGLSVKDQCTYEESMKL